MRQQDQAALELYQSNRHLLRDDQERMDSLLKEYFSQVRAWQHSPSEFADEYEADIDIIRKCLERK